MTTQSTAPAFTVDGRWPGSYCRTLACQAPIIWAVGPRGRIALNAEPDRSGGTYSLRDAGGAEPAATPLRPHLAFGRQDLRSIHSCGRRSRERQH